MKDNYPDKKNPKALPKWVDKLPKQIVILGVTYRIKYNMLRGACFCCEDLEITVGCRTGRENTLHSLIHEISEIVHVHLLNRFYNGPDNGDNRFFMDHDGFDQHNSGLVAALMSCGIIK